MSKWKTILFDLDGTIVDSSEGITNCVKYALEEAGVPIPEYSQLLKFIGPPLVEGFQENVGMNLEEAKKSTTKYRERYETIGLYEAHLYEGIDGVIQQLHNQGYRIALATSKPELYARKILEYFGLATYFDEMIGADDSVGRSAKSEVIFEALSRLKLSDDEISTVIMVGDRKHDILGAKQFGLASLGVYYGFAPRGELEEFGADYIVHTVKQLGEFFDKPFC